jgi:hypothetical protein
MFYVRSDVQLALTLNPVAEGTGHDVVLPFHNLMMLI